MPDADIDDADTDIADPTAADAAAATNTEGAADTEDGEPDPAAAAADDQGTPGGPWRRRAGWTAASAAVTLLAAWATVGVAGALRSPVPAAERIPTPPAKNAAFVADNFGAGEDQQGNVLQRSAPGVVTLRSAAGTDLGSGFVITRSGYVLAADQGVRAGATLTVRLVMSGKRYTARVVGSDPAANVALLQLSGSGFTPVAIGTADDLSLNDRVASGGGDWSSTGVLLSTGGITGIDVPVTLDGQRLTGLLQDTALGAPASELGGPLFNLSGQVVGLSVGYGAGAGYAVPIDSALQLARQIVGQ